MSVPESLKRIWSASLGMLQKGHERHRAALLDRFVSIPNPNAISDRNKLRNWFQERSSMRKALASLRSGVSKPSENQP